MMNFAPSNPLAKSRIKASSLNATIWLTSLVLLIILAFGIYLASRTPGTTLDALAFMTVFP